MREPRNPFKLLNSEVILNEETFLRLLAPDVLDLLPKVDIWNLIHIFRSTPGGGKTTLFRLFTPRCLLTIYDNRSNLEYKELFNRLNKLNVLSEDGINTLGIYVSCDHDYDELNDMNLNPQIKRSVFFTLLNCRIIYSALRGIISLNNLGFPNDLSRITVDNKSNKILPLQIDFPCTGKQLFERIREIEFNILNVLDSFVPTKLTQILAANSLFCTNLLRPDSIFVDGEPFTKSTLILLDDLHSLTDTQRVTLFKTMSDIRSPVGIWIAERLEALNKDEIFKGMLVDREFGSRIYIEKEWKKKHSKYASLMREIANRRTKFAYESNVIQFMQFQSSIEDNLDGSMWLSKYKEALNVINKRLNKKIVNKSKFSEWLYYINGKSLITREKVIELRMLEILMEREKQETLFDAPLSVTLLKTKMNNNIKTAAEYLIATEFDFPHYYGMDNLIKLSSYNIEQFLHITGEIFEEAISSTWLTDASKISAQRQEAIIIKSAEKFWESLPQTVVNSRDVQQFVIRLVDYCKRENRKKSFPYIPGATGIGIRSEELRFLTNVNNINYLKLADTIATCVTNNILEPEPDHKQGKVGKRWLVLYLNRHLCAYFGLPLGYGGWRPRRVRELLQWVKTRNQTVNKELEI